MSALHAIGRGLGWPLRRLRRARLRYKLALSLVVAALVPMLLVAALASSVVFGNLEGSLDQDARRQLAVGLNLTLRSIERLGHEATRLAGQRELPAAIEAGPEATRDVLARVSQYLPAALVQIADRDGHIIVSAAIGGDDQRFAGLGRADGDPALIAAITSAPRVSLERTPRGVVVRASAPVVGAGLDAGAVVVMTTPLDGGFVDGVRAALGGDVLIGGLDEPLISTVRDRDAVRAPPIGLAADVAKAIRDRRRPLTSATIGGRAYTVALTALGDGRAVATFGVALDRAPLVRARRIATRSLVVSAALALLFALVIANLMAGQVGRPIAKLHRGALAISRGELDHRIEVAGGDEIGDLAAAFAQMTAALEDNQRRLAERMGELVALHDQVGQAREELEQKVQLRTAELTTMNIELGRALADLRNTQAQLVLSERMATLGMLVAGVAHEINSPSAAIRGAADAMTVMVTALTEPSHDLAAAVPDPVVRAELIARLERAGQALAARPLPVGSSVRRQGRELRALLAPGLGHVAPELGTRLAEAGAGEALVLELIDRRPPEAAAAILRTLCGLANLHRNALVIGHAIARIQRIVGALKTYSHLDEEPARAAVDLHEGLETTLALFDYALRDITLVRRYGPLPPVKIFVDELNQVWTNLIHNAVQAVGGKGTIEIATDTASRRRPGADGDDVEGVVVRVIDDGAGIDPQVMPRIFEPFFTTKPKGEGSGLGLGIVTQIVAKHGGEVGATSVPGRTVFEVWLPVDDTGPAVAAAEAAS